MLAALVECIHARFGVDWVSGGARLRVFDYDRDAKTFIATPRASGRASITPGANSTTIAIEGTNAAVLSDAGVFTCKKFVEGKAPLESPRLEFMRTYRTTARVAALTKSGTFHAYAIKEADEIPPGTDHFSFYDLIAIGQGGLTAVEIAEASSL